MKDFICKNHEGSLFLIGDINIHTLDYFLGNKNGLDFFNSAFQGGVFHVINRPTRVTKSSATIIDYVLNNRFRSTKWYNNNRYKQSLCCACLNENKFGTIKYF